MKGKKQNMKKTYRSENDKKEIISRLNRIEGQIRGVKNMIEENADCDDVLIQLKSIENATRSISNYVLENHLYTCVADNLKNGNLEMLDEIVHLFKKFNK